ncbi:hypothetical protein C8R42DRAFT_722869 [Lentinula raphanica]|nr:hypothetical protein C8R42DRAFT_722869 [Lentinula raphanica]
MSTSLSSSNNLDMLALSSASSTSLSSSTSGLSSFTLFDRKCNNSGSSQTSQTDISPPGSPFGEDAEDTCISRRRLFELSPNECWNPSLKETLEKPNKSGSTYRSGCQESPYAESPTAVDEAGYEAEASDDNDQPVFALAKDRKRKKRTLKPKQRAGHQAESIIELDRVELCTQLPSTILDEQDFDTRYQSTLPLSKPVLRPKFEDLDSPSPIVALPSPRFLNSVPRLLQVSPFLAYQIDTAAQLFPEHDRIRRVAGVKSGMGLGLSIPGMLEPRFQSSILSSNENTVSPDLTRPTANLQSDKAAKKKALNLIGLGIQLPQGSPSEFPSVSPSIMNPTSTIDTECAKRRSFLGLGHGVPSARKQSRTILTNTQSIGDCVTAVHSSQSTIRLVTPSNSVRDPIMSEKNQEEPQDVDLVRQRRAGITLDHFLSQKEPSRLRKRQLYPIFESPTPSTRSVETTSFTILPTSNCVLDSASLIDSHFKTSPALSNEPTECCKTKTSSFRKASSSPCSPSCSDYSTALSYEMNPYCSSMLSSWDPMLAKTLF